MMVSIAGAVARIGELITVYHAMRRLAVFAALTLVVVAIMASLVLVQGMDRQINDMTRTYEMRNQARELSLALTDAESAHLGNVLTGNESYGAIYRAASATVGAGMRSLMAMTADDPVQLARVQEISADIDQRLADLGARMDIVAAREGPDANARPMDPARLALDQFAWEQNQNLLARNLSIDQARRWLVGAIVVALAGAVTLAYLLFTRTQNEVRELVDNRALLQSQNEDLEAHIRADTLAADEAHVLVERESLRVEALLKDTSHRIGNSLSTVSSLLGLQLLNSNSQEVKQALEAARSRVHAIASAHRRLRLTDDLQTARTDELIEAVLHDLANTVSETQLVSLVGEIDPFVISARDATTIGILVAELVTNALNHAFPDGREGRIIVRLNRDADGVPTLSVIDDGVGIKRHCALGEGGLGSVIIEQLAHQFGGTPTYQRRAEGGLSVVVALPRIERRQATA